MRGYEIQYSLLLLLSMMALITGFSCPPTIYFKFITKCDKCYYKVRQVLQSVTILLQSATIITKCDSTEAARVTATLYFSNRYLVRSSGDCFTKPKCTECFWKVSSISLRKNSVRQNGMRFESVLEYAIICLSHISDTVRASWRKLPTPPPKSSEKRQTC